MIVAAIFVVDVPVVGVSTAEAQPNVTVAPTRLVFEDRDRTEELVLLNRGDEAVTYRVSLIGMKMEDDGSLERIDEPGDGQQFAHELLRFAPRQVHLGPGESQRIRVSVRKPSDLEEGEYRSHMLFQAVPDTPATDGDGTDEDDGELALRLNIISGISIAAIVRHGELSADIEIDDLDYVESDDEQMPDMLRFRLHRDGEQSVYGDLRAEFLPDGAGEAGDEEVEPVTISRRNGTAVYTPNDSRDLEMPVHPPDDVELDGGRIVVTYETESGETLTTGDIELP